MPLARRLPMIAVPLRQAESDAALDLQPLIDKSYRNAACDLRVDYTQDADPPLAGTATAWADALLRGAGRRPPVPPSPPA